MRYPLRFVLFLLLLPLLTRAQEAEISGTVTGEAGDTLIGCSVRVVGSVIGASTNVEGHYSLEVPPGRIRLLFSYIGYEDVDTTLQVGSNDREFELDVVLGQGFIDAPEAIVYGRRASGQAQALRVQQSALNAQTIIHAELFNKYPDITLAETVQRMPGVTITRNRGEGELVQVRGLPEQYTAISLNGQRLPAVQPEADRAGSLDIIQSNLVDEVRVIKARSADMDADAIGGTVDFRIRQPDQKAEVLVQAGGGTNFGFDQFPGQSSGITQGSAVLNSELNDETLYGLLAGSYFRHARGNRTRRYDYGTNGVEDGPLSRVRPIDTDRITTKKGVVGAIELRPSIYNRLRLSYNYASNDDEVQTQETNFNRRDFAQEQRISSRWKEERRLNMVALEVENNFNKLLVDYALSFATTSERLIDRQRSFASTLSEQAEPLGDADFAGLVTTDTRFPGVILGNRKVEQQNLDLDEDIAIGGVNFTYYLNDRRTTFVRAGGRYRIKERTYREFYDSRPFGDGTSVTAPAFPILSEDNLLATDPDLDAGPNYYASEKIAAGYLMYVANFSANLTASAGLRYEYTDLDYTLLRDGATDSTSYNNLFPSVNLTYRIRRDRQLRFSYYEAIARVPYATVVPTQGFTERRQARLDVYSIGNTDVSPTYSRNFDLTYERYGKRDGLFSVSAYAKFLHDPTIRTAEFALVDLQPSLGYSLSNTADADLYGLEVGFYQNLGFINANYRFLNLNGTANFNSYQLKNSDVDGATLAQAPRRSANLSLVYSNPEQRLNLVLAGNYRSSTLDLLRDGQPIWVNSVISLDLAADYELFKNISAYLRLNNATDHRAQRWIGKPDDDGSRLILDTNYGVWTVIGLRWRPS